MNSSTRVSNRPSRAARAALLAIGLTMGLTTGCYASPAMQTRDVGAGPDLSIGASEFPDDDAIILRWEQRWTVGADGTVHRRDHRWVKLLNDRAVGRYADPRIDFDHVNEQVIIHTARTHLSDGTILPVPDYSFNIAAPGDVAGWPEYADWQQWIVSFSGIEDGCVLELDYEIVTQPGVLPWVSADLRLNDDDSTVQRIVSLTAPESVNVLFRIDNIPGDVEHRQATAGDAGTTHTWTFRNLTGAPGEPQSPPWQERCGRLRFTTVGNAVAYCEALLREVENSAVPDERIAGFAKKAAGDGLDAKDRVEVLVGKLRATFNFLNSSKTIQSLRCRSASQVFQANYGNPLEAGALLVAACRVLDLKVAPAVAVDGHSWDCDAPADSSFAGIVAVIETESGPIYVHPQVGVFANPGAWGQHKLLSVNQAGELQETYVASRGENQGSLADIAGRIELAADGSAQGELRLILTGAFFDPANTRTTAAQTALARSFVNRLMAGFDVTDCALTALSNDKFQATVRVLAAEPLPSLQESHLLTLGDDPVSLGTFPLPLDRSARRTDVQLPGPFVEKVDLTFVLPEGHEPKVLPAGVVEASGRWGGVFQTVDREGSEVRILRQIEVKEDRIRPEDFAAIRDAMNFLRTERSRLLLWGK